MPPSGLQELAEASLGVSAAGMGLDSTQGQHHHILNKYRERVPDDETDAPVEMEAANHPLGNRRLLGHACPKWNI